jgi:spermidine synthase
VRLYLALALMVASGFAALGLQIVWTRQSAAWLGQESAAVLGVVSAFFGGLALGALVLGRPIRDSRHPLRWYAGSEAVVAAWSLLLLVLLGPAAAALLRATGIDAPPWRQWAIAFGGTLLLLLPATVAMGATLPAMERVLAGSGRSPRSVAALYAANTAGAVLGVLAAAFWLVPVWGLAATAATCAALCASVAALAWWALGRGGGGTEPADGAVPLEAGEAVPERGLVLRLGATGLLGIGYEVLVVRALSQVAENTVYTFALLLAVYLVGTAAGAALLHRWLRGRPPGVVLRDRLLLGLALACLVGSASLWGLQPLHEALRSGLAGTFGASLGAALAAEAALAVVAFGPATLLMGALFSVLALQAAASGLGLGRALGWNTLGAALAPPLLGVLVLATWGHKAALLVVALGYLALLSPPARRGAPAALVLGAGAALALAAPPLQIVDRPDGARLVHHEAGATAAVSVLETADGVRTLHIDNRQPEGSNATAWADERQALLPLLLHPAPRQALLLGLGSGVTAAAAAQDRQLQVHAVELLPEVVRAAALFTPALAASTPHPRLTVHVADARRFVRVDTGRYDLVVADNFHPARSGSAALYTVEHFAAVKARLAEQGLFCQWLPLHQMDLATLKAIVRSYTEVFPHAWAVLATHSLETPVVGLLARADGRRLPWPALQARLAQAQLERPPAEGGIDNEWALLGGFVAGPRALQRWSADAPRNTDDHPVVATLAPRITYAPDSRPRERLLQWLQEVGITADELLDDGADPAAAARLQAYWAARQRYLQAGRDVRPSSDARTMLRQVQGPLIEVLRLSPDFRPAYQPLVQMAQALAPSDRDAAARLLRELQQIQPAWPEAGAALQAIDAPTLQR